MYCEECGSRRAVFTVTRSVPLSPVETRLLCTDCVISLLESMERGESVRVLAREESFWIQFNIQRELKRRCFFCYRVTEYADFSSVTPMPVCLDCFRRVLEKWERRLLRRVIRLVYPRGELNDM